MDTRTADAPQPNISTFDRWKCTYELFASSLDSFLKESASFGIILQQSDTQKWPGFEEATRYIGNAYTSLETRLPELRSVHIALGVARNQSRTLVPLNKLPLDTMMHILSLANMECVTNPSSLGTNPPLLHRLFNTSRYLRNVLIHIPSLWAHVDLVAERPDAFYHCKRCLKHSGQLPLRIHVFEDEASVGPFRLANLAQLVRSHARRVVALNFKSTAALAGSFLLEFWRNIGISSSPIEEFYFSDYLGRRTAYYNDFFSVLEGQSGMFVRNIQRLKLHGVSVPLSNSVYRGLTVLKLVPSTTVPRPTIVQLANALAACPDLRSLALVGIELRACSQQIEQVVLPKLEVFDLRLLSGTDLRRILSYIIPGSENLALSVTVPLQEDGVTGPLLRQYVKDLKVKRLLTEAADGLGNLDWLFGYIAGNEISDVRELALVNYNVESIRSDFISNPHRFSGLHTLHLLGSTIDPSILRTFLDGSEIQMLRMESSSSPLASQYQSSKISEFIPTIIYQEYSVLCQGEGDLEWPVYTP